MEAPELPEDPHAMADRWFMADASDERSPVGPQAGRSDHIHRPVALEIQPEAVTKQDGLRILAISDMHTIPVGGISHKGGDSYRSNRFVQEMIKHADYDVLLTCGDYHDHADLDNPAPGPGQPGGKRQAPGGGAGQPRSALRQRS